MTPLAGKVDYVWGQSLNVKGPPLPSMQVYIPFDRDAEGHPLEYWKANHPDWIVYQCDQSKPAYEFHDSRHVPLDISNPEVQDYQMQEMASPLSKSVVPGASFTGISWDNVDLFNQNRCGIWRDGRWIPISNSKAVLSWAESMYKKFKAQYPEKEIAMNLRYHPLDLQLIPYTDLVTSEDGFTRYATGFSTDADWEARAKFFEQLDQQGKAFFLIGEVPAPSHEAVTPAQINWVLGNYLMVKGKHSYANIYYYDPVKKLQSYGGFYDRPEFHAPIGHPTSARYPFQNVQRRDYSNGLVLVNPSSTQSSTVGLP